MLNVVAPAPQIDPARRLKRPMRVANFFRSDSRCRSVQFNAEIRWLSREGQDASFGSNLKLTSCLLVVQEESSGDRLSGTELQLPFP